jgi:multimeric flavodoxin WrbA
MKILAIITSLRKKNTYGAVKKFEEAHQAYTDNCEYEYLFIKDLNFKQCRGCFLCISHGEDKCPLKDDRDLIIRKIESADCIILAGPNYSMNVNWLTKNMIDRFAYNLHRPMYFNKRFIMLITSGNYMGTKQALKALSVFPSGGKIIGKLVLYTAPELRDKKRLKQDRKFSKKINHIFKLLDKDYRHTPSLLYAFWFASFKAASEMYNKTLRADYEFYRDREYFIETELSIMQKFIIKRFTGLFKFMIRKGLM